LENPEKEFLIAETRKDGNAEEHPGSLKNRLFNHGDTAGMEFKPEIVFFVTR
jgi:hypothetical protein